jgi:hypothetical protein
MSKRRFSKEEFESELYDLKKNQSMKYPANGYQTMFHAKKALHIFERRGFKDEAVSKTHRLITRTC